ncbi:hypothetical protein JCM11491_002097 [Sporobolomyces phaffii]
MSQYTPLASESTAQLPLYSDSPTSSSSSPRPSASTRTPAAASDSKALLATDHDDTEDDDLATEIKQYAAHTSPDPRRHWYDALPVRPRTILFSVLSLAILVSLFLFFHPASTRLGPAVSHDAASYYSGAPLSIGLFDPALGKLASNPLESDATFADVPFAAVGETWDEQGRKPAWAGGDGGSATFEKQLDKAGKRFWNGTNWFDKTVILVTMDGMRPDYLSPELTPNLLEFAAKGLRAEHLEPVSPSLSAPNHWSILTGLYPASHGIVSNRFRSATSSRTFDSESETPGETWDPEWYKGEPIYQTALRSSLRVATLMHPLVPPVLPSASVKPTYWYPAVAHTHPRKKLAKLLAFLDESYQKRPHLVVTHFDEVAHQARKGGMRSKGVDKGLKMVDESFFGGLYQALDERGLKEWIEVVVVGATGIADVERDRVVVLDEVIDTELMKNIETPLEGGASTVVGLRLDSTHVGFAAAVDDLRAASKGGEAGFDVYLREELPDAWHASAQDNRLAQLWLVAKEGWIIANRDEYDETKGKTSPKASNGYDPSVSPAMNSIFLSSGPYTTALHQRVVKGFSNLEIYDFVANALDLAPETRALNNGTSGYWDQLPNEAHPSSPRSSAGAPTPDPERSHSLHAARFRLSPSPSRVPQIAFEPSSFSPSPPPPPPPPHPIHSHSPRGVARPPQRPPASTRSASFGAYDSSAYRTSFTQATQGLSANSSPFSPPLSSSALAPSVPAVSNSAQPPPTSSTSSSTQPLLAEIFSGRPRPHFRSSTSYSHASSSQPADSQNPRGGSNLLPSSPTVQHPAATTEAPSYFAAPNRPPPHHSNRARSQSSAPAFDAIDEPPHRSNRTSSPVGMTSNVYGAPGSGSGLSQSFAADQHGWRPSSHAQPASQHPGPGGGAASANHFSASLPTTSAVGSPTFSSFTGGARDLSSSPSSRAIGGGYSPFARPSSSLASGPPAQSLGGGGGAKPGAFLSQSFSTGWEDFEREREGRARVRDTWGESTTTSASSINTTPGTGLSPFSRDSSRLTEETNTSDLPPILSSSVGAASGTDGSNTWGVPTGLGPGGVYKARRDYSLGAVGSGRKRSDSAWGGTRERILREQDEDDEDFSSAGYAPPTKSGATSRRHSFAAFEGPFGGRTSSQTVGFHLPEDVHKEVTGGFSDMSSPVGGGVSNGLRMGGMGSSAIDDDDLAADLNSLHLSLDAHAREQQQQRQGSSAGTTTSTLHVGSMPVDFPPARSRRFDTSRSPPDAKSTLASTSPAPPSLSALPGSPRATAEPFTPSLAASAAAPTSRLSHQAPGGISTTSSVASRFFQAPSPLPPTTTNAIATATPGTGGGPSRFDFFGMPSQHPQQQRFGLPPPTQQQQQQQQPQQGFYNPNNRGPPPPPSHLHHQHRQGPPPALGSTFSPFAPSPYQSPALPPPLHHHMMNAPPQQQQQQQQPVSNYFAPLPLASNPQQQQQQQSQQQQQQGPATALTSQSQSDMSLGRGVPLHAIPPDAPLCIVGFKAGRKDLFFCEDPALVLEEGDLVIVEADRGRDVGKYLKRCSIDEVHKFQQHMVELALGQLANPASMTAMGFGPQNTPGQGGQGGGGGGPGAGPAQLARMTKECQPKRIYAKAGPADTHALLAKAQDEVKALQLVRGKVAQKGLPMEILDAEWQWDRRKLTFYYTADQRVDFRELVRELFRIWKTRVWLCCLDQQQPGLDFV